MALSASRGFQRACVAGVTRTDSHCASLRTKLPALCVASHLTYPRMYHAREQTSSQAGYAMCVLHRPHVGHLETEYAMCVAFGTPCGPPRQLRKLSTPCASLPVPMWAIPATPQLDTQCASLRSSCGPSQHPKREKARADSALCVASHTNDPCVVPSGHGLQRAARSPSAGRETASTPGLRW